MLSDAGSVEEEEQEEAKMVVVVVVLLLRKAGGGIGFSQASDVCVCVCVLRCVQKPGTKPSSSPLGLGRGTSREARGDWWSCFNSGAASRLALWVPDDPSVSIIVKVHYNLPRRHLGTNIFLDSGPSPPGQSATAVSHLAKDKMK